MLSIVYVFTLRVNIIALQLCNPSGYTYTMLSIVYVFTLRVNIIALQLCNPTGYINALHLCLPVGPL